MPLDPTILCGKIVEMFLYAAPAFWQEVVVYAYKFADGVNNLQSVKWETRLPALKCRVENESAQSSYEG